MKRHVFIGWFLLLALSACHPKQDDSVETQNFASLQPVPSVELQAIDSLLWQQPDSALALLLPWFDTVDSNETFDNHYAHLLLAELLYKNDYAQTNREELLQAVAYFDSLVRQAPPTPPLKGGRGDSRHALDQNGNFAFLAARAHYINGVGYYEQDSVVQACKEYIKALEIMEDRFEEKELVGDKARFMAFTHTHLTGLFSDQYLHEQAIYFGARALDYYRKYEATPWHVAWMLDEIGMQFEMMERFDSASYYYGEAVIAVDDTNTLMYRDIATGLARLSYKKDKELQKSMSQLRNLLLRSESEKEYLARCIAIGGIYYYEKQYDSASAYLNRIFRDSQSVEARKQAAEWLVEICKSQGREDEIIGYATFLVPFATQDENAGKVKSQITELCHVYEQERLENLHQKQMRRIRKHVGITLASLLVVLLVVLWLNNRYRKNKKIEEQRQAEAYRKLQSEFEAASQQVQQVLQRRVAEICRSKEENKRERILAEFETAYPDGMEKLQAGYPDLTDTERNIVILSFFGFRTKEEAEILHLSVNTVEKYRSNIRKKAGSDPVFHLIG